MSIEFEPWPKIPRLRRDIIVTEKIDGTNAAVRIHQCEPGMAGILKAADPNVVAEVITAEGPALYGVWAQSRKRFITPEQDNAGFARWVYENASELVAFLGEGIHFGEWWGQGIQRGYGLDHKRFSLFNTKRWANDAGPDAVPGLSVVPVLGIRTWSDDFIQSCLDHLAENGSVAAPGFMDPEGVVVYHTASGTMGKVLLKGDELPKGVTTRLERELATKDEPLHYCSALEVPHRNADCEGT